MKFDNLLDTLYFYLPFVLLFGVIGIAVVSEFGCTVSEDSFTDKIVRNMRPTLLG